MNRKNKNIILDTIVVMFSSLFLYSGICKLADYDVFREQLRASPFLAPVAGLVAAALPWVEFLVVIFLVTPRWRLRGLYAALGLMTLFVLFICAMMAFDPQLPCSCGGIIEELSWPEHIVFNCIFIALALVGWTIERRRLKNQRLALAGLV